MKNKIHKILSSLFLLALISCGPAMLPQTQTPTATVDNSMFLTAEMGSTLGAMLTLTAIPCDGCPGSDLSAYMTSQMATNFASTPSNTPPAWATVIPVAGDLGWGTVNGTVLDAVTNLPLRGVIVRCDHFSYTSTYRCDEVTLTDENGYYIFKDIFFHDTDRITLTAELPGYAKTEITQSTFVQADLHVDMGLFPEFGGSPTLVPTSYMVCTPPICVGGVLACGTTDGCPGGCGTICASPTPPQISCTPPACSGGQLICGSTNGCPGGCGTICQMPTP